MTNSSMRFQHEPNGPYDRSFVTHDRSFVRYDRSSLQYPVTIRGRTNDVFH
jgi:hypothetical protein